MHADEQDHGALGVASVLGERHAGEVRDLGPRSAHVAVADLLLARQQRVEELLQARIRHRRGRHRSILGDKRHARTAFLSIPTNPSWQLWSPLRRQRVQSSATITPIYGSFPEVNFRSRPHPDRTRGRSFPGIGLGAGRDRPDPSRRDDQHRRLRPMHVELHLLAGERHLHRPGRPLLLDRRGHRHRRLHLAVAAARHPGRDRRRLGQGHARLQLLADDAGQRRGRRGDLRLQRPRAGPDRPRRRRQGEPFDPRLRRSDRRRHRCGRPAGLHVRELVAARRRDRAQPEERAGRRADAGRLELQRLHADAGHPG